jgi:general secretion pathway protein N
MIRSFAIGLALLALSVHSVASATAVSDALDADFTDNARPGGPSAMSSAPAEPVTTVRVVAPPAAPARTPSANPLWGIPLTQLSGTRDRPIFSPSRRPPPPVVAAEPVLVKPPPPRKQEVEPPRLSLVGTIASGDEGFGIFLDQSTKAALRLKVGEDYQGWKLRAIQGREVTMEKDQQAAVLTLPQPGDQSSGEVRLVPVSAVKMPVATRR